MGDSTVPVAINQQVSGQDHTTRRPVVYRSSVDLWILVLSSSSERVPAKAPSDFIGRCLKIITRGFRGIRAAVGVGECLYVILLRAISDSCAGFENALAPF